MAEDLRLFVMNSLLGFSRNPVNRRQFARTSGPQPLPGRVDLPERGLLGRSGVAGTAAMEDFGAGGRVAAAAAWKAALHGTSSALTVLIRFGS
jgi:hypothetical protein